MKTRLAKSIGDRKALEIYQKLLMHTESVTRSILVAKTVYYDTYIPEKDLWDKGSYLKSIQQGADLGLRMRNAFDKAFANGYKQIVIIGSDCPEVTQAIIEQAFDCLATYDFVIGPAYDGGYYLLGMKAKHLHLFENKSWSTSTVYQSTLNDIKNLSSNYYLLPVMSDVDEEKDLSFIKVGNEN